MMRRFVLRVLNLFQSARPERDLAREINAHLALLEEEHRRRGLSDDAARLAARRAMGSVALAKDLHRDARSVAWMEDVGRDVRHAVRSLRRVPGLALVAILTVAIGIGANIAVFGLVYQTLIRPLPFANPDELVTLASHVPQVADRMPLLPVPPRDFLEYRQSNTVFAALSALQGRDFNLTGSGEPERLHGARVSANVFSMLGVAPVLGRTFTPEEDEAGHDDVAIISHALWERRFGADPAIIGRSILLDSRSTIVVGVMPSNLLFPVGRQLFPLTVFGPRVEIWKPIAFTRQELAQEGNFDFAVIGRLKPGISPIAAKQHMDVLAQRNIDRIRKQTPVDIELSTRVTPLHAFFVGQSRRGLLILQAAVGLLLLIACVNLANVFLARASSRAQEFAVRTALGASRRRLIRQLLTESLVVSCAGTVAGIAAAVAVGPLLLHYGPQTAVAREWTLDRPVMAFAVIAALATGLLFGIVPALQWSASAICSRVRDAAREISDSRATRIRTSLIAAEVALCTGLLAVAGLLLHSFVNVVRVDAGFAVERVLAVDLSLPRQNYPQDRTLAFYRELIARVRALPDVAAAGAISLLPIAHGGTISTILLESDRQVRLDRPTALRRMVTPGLFAAMDIPLRAGRTFQEHEPQRVAILSERLTRRLWPGRPLATILGEGVRTDPGDPVMTVVGIVGDTRADALDREAPAVLYHPFGQVMRQEMSLVVRTSDDPLSVASAVRAAVSSLDRDLPIASMRAMSDIVSSSVDERRFQMMLVSLLGLLALALVVVGIYGITNYAVARRTREIGLRVALGAERRDVMRSTMSEGLKPVVIGLLIGGIAGQLAALPIRSLLFGVRPFDATSHAGVAGLLLCAAVLACYVPARRATQIDPMVALRAE